MLGSSRAEDRWSSLRDFVRKTRALWWTTGVIVLAMVIMILWKAPQVQVKYADIPAKDRFNSENEARKTLATILGGIVVLAGAYFTWRNIKVAQEGQITDRFTKAIEQLGAVDASGKKKLEVRLGGIYALERIANQSERDYWPIAEVLSTYVRENAPPTRLPHPPADIQAILTVLGRRDRKWERKNQRLDLSDTDIHGANLRGAYLRRAYLSRADLSEAVLSEAVLSEAYLSRANLRGACLSGACLSRANLGEAYLSGADLSRADLIGADLSEVDLGYALNLTQEQLDTAKGDATTQLPDDLHMPESWKT
jgi:hypothetical protein